MSIWTIVLIILIIAAVGALPVWPHATNFGWMPAGGLGIVLLIVLILVVAGVIR